MWNLPTFVISTLTSERRTFIIEQMNHFNLHWQFFDAITPESFHLHSFTIEQEKFILKKSRPITAGEIGCALSHIELWKRCIELNTPILILEDDAKLELSFESALDIAKKMQPYWDYFRLYGLHQYTKGTLILGNSGEFQILDHLRDPCAATAYIIKPDGALKLLTHLNAFFCPIDDYVGDFRFIHQTRILSLASYPVSIADFKGQIPGRAPIKKSIRYIIKRELYRTPESIKARIWRNKRIKELKNSNIYNFLKSL